ncbi:uncharacterized protein EI90DRAFT_3044110 [Cantharellus anzutake]|uniref:uncharacterized protein n=1 Tax=Cantharellus anzutake TaxID=1750568 RepID=UPI001908E714|nr:uncharacterized protein EI90DRAFT_3044110 [Cantharellus anzutake]KAF8336914.1 hypothetical protein EI90DRAFT_3044110 [Cantharellus anzutake]
MSSARIATTATRKRSTTGCLVCRLRGKRCVRPSGSPVCSDCNYFRIQCHGRVGSIPSRMRNHYACQAAREEIHDAISSAKSRIYHHTLPATEKFSGLLERAMLSRLNTRATPSPQYRAASPQHRVRPSDTSTPATSPISSSGTMDSAHSELIPGFTSFPLLPPYVSSPAPDFDLLPGSSTSSMASDQSMNWLECDGQPPIPTYLDSSLPQQDIHVIIESLRPFLWKYGYELVPFR